MSAPLYDIDDGEQAKTVSWREAELKRVGFTPLDASVVAIRRDIDLHDVLDLVAAGCAHRVAMDIVL